MCIDGLPIYSGHLCWFHWKKSLVQAQSQVRKVGNDPVFERNSNRPPQDMYDCSIVACMNTHYKQTVGTFLHAVQRIWGN
jgi:hypothetical protein